GEPLAVRFADVSSAPRTRGHRFAAPQEIPLPTARDSVRALRKAHVLADWAERSGRVSEEVVRAAREAGGVPRPDPDLLETVTGLVEEPSAIAGYFEKEFLQLPPEVLVSGRRGHQKYLAVQSDEGGLLPAFVAVSNTKVRDPAVSRKGYERVLRARLSDGKFFFDEDRKMPLRSRVEKLARRTFLQGLGTELERVGRLRELSLWFHGATGRGDPRQLAEAAELCKADLTTGMVGEFPELQGSMGRVYALQAAQKLHGKEDSAVRERIWQFVLARFEVLLRERAQPDSVQAALHTGATDLVSLEKRVSALQTVREKSRAQFEATAAAFKRIGNILAQAQQKGIAFVGFHAALCKSGSEQALSAALEQSRARVSGALAEKEDYRAAYAALAELRPVVDRFFDDVMVMDSDTAQRDNRLALLRSLHELFAPLADFSRLQVEKSA